MAHPYYGPLPHNAVDFVCPWERSMREEDPLEAVQCELVAWWRGLKQSAAAEIGRRLYECMA